MKRFWVLIVLLAAAASCGRATGPTDPSDDRFAILAPASGSADLGLMFTEAGAGVLSSA